VCVCVCVCVCVHVRMCVFVCVVDLLYKLSNKHITNQINGV